MAISAQGATLTLTSGYGPYALTTVMSQVIDYDVQYSRRDDSFGTVRIRALENNAVNRIALYQYRRLTIQHGGVRTFDGWVFATGVSIVAVTNDIVRYQFEFSILSIPQVN